MGASNLKKLLKKKRVQRIAKGMREALLAEQGKIKSKSARVFLNKL